MSLSEPEAVIIAALITATFGVVAVWVSSRVQRKKAPQRKQAKDAWVNELIERICAVYERQIAWFEADSERRDRVDDERRRTDDERREAERRSPHSGQ